MDERSDRRIRGLAEYHLLGRSGLRVSPLCLGTMTFGTEWGWGADETVSRAMFHRYLEAGGNFIDTADAATRTRQRHHPKLAHGQGPRRTRSLKRSIASA